MKPINRRNFITASASISALTILQPSTVFGSKANSAIRLGIIGCGNRGTSVISDMVKHTRGQIIAMADLFDYQLEKAKPTFDKLNIDDGGVPVQQSKMYQGSKAHQQLINDKDVDAVLISSPAFTHPDFLEKSVLAGKHTYCEKPVAPDIAGCKKVIQTGNRAKGKVSIAIGFQIRHATPYIELVKRIKRGDIGEIVNAQLYYISSPVKKVLTKGDSREEFMIRNHFHFRELSGGILLDQGIHMIDVFNWVNEELPVTAVGNGNRKGGPDFGDTFTNYQAIYNFPKDLNVSIHSTQFGAKFGDVCARFIGTRGIAEAHYNRGVYIEGENPWDSGVLRGQEPTPEQKKAGVFTSSLHDSTKNRVKHFINSIESDNLINEAESGSNSTLSAILGRISATSQKKTTWDEMYYSNQKYKLELNLNQFDK